MDANGNLLLAIDTSTEMTGIALYDGSRVSELVWNAGRNQTTTLLNQVTHLLSMNGYELPDLRAIGVAMGPGTFNGLRVGLSTAKGLGFGCGIPVYGVGTLDATAYPHRTATSRIRAFVPAGRGRTVFCDYQQRNGRWMRVGEMQNLPFGELLAGLSEETLVAGEAPSGMDPEDNGSPHAMFPRLALRVRRPSYVAEIAWRRWRNGDDSDLASLEPVYVHGVRAQS